MKINRTKPSDLDLKSLMKFYARKAKDGKDGQFYKVYHRGRKLFTEWANTQDELRAWLVTSQIDFDRIQELQ